MITTDRLQIRHVQSNDIDDIYEYISNDEVMKYERENYPTKESYLETLEYFVDNQLLYSIMIKGETKVIGHIYLGLTGAECNNEYNLGYIMNPQYQGKGYCTEAAKAVMDHAFSELHANRVIGACNPENIPSWKVMEKIGMQKEAYFKKRFFIRNDDEGNPIYTDELVYGLHVLDWIKSRK